MAAPSTSRRSTHTAHKRFAAATPRAPSATAALSADRRAVSVTAGCRRVALHAAPKGLLRVARRRLSLSNRGRRWERGPDTSKHAEQLQPPTQTRGKIQNWRGAWPRSFAELVLGHARMYRLPSASYRTSLFRSNAWIVTATRMIAP